LAEEKLLKFGGLQLAKKVKALREQGAKTNAVWPQGLSTGAANHINEFYR